MSNPCDLDRNLGLPQFRVVDLLVLTTSFAVGMALEQARANLGGGGLFSPETSSFDGASVLIYAALTGIPLGAICCTLVERCFFNTSREIQPGHWLLLSLLPGTFYLVFSVFREVIPHPVVSGLMSAVSAIILLYAGKRNTGFWRIGFFLLALIAAKGCTSEIVFFLFNKGLFNHAGTATYNAISNWIDFVSNPSISCILLIVTITELRNKVKRDLWHWAGVLTAMLMTAVLPLLYSFR